MCVQLALFIQSHWIYKIEKKKQQQKSVTKTKTVHNLLWILNYLVKTDALRKDHYLSLSIFKFTFHTHQFQIKIKQEEPVSDNLLDKRAAGQGKEI